MFSNNAHKYSCTIYWSTPSSCAVQEAISVSPEEWRSEIRGIFSIPSVLAWGGNRVGGYGKTSMAEAKERVVEMSRGKTEAIISESLHRVTRRTTDHRPTPPSPDHPPPYHFCIGRCGEAILMLPSAWRPLTPR